MNTWGMAITPCVHSWMCYPYLWFWVRTVTGRPYKIAFPPSRNIPLLYFYGVKKRATFHSQRFLEKIEEAEGSKCIEATNCGHWIQTQDPDLVVKELKEFIA